MNPSIEIWGVYGSFEEPNRRSFTMKFLQDGDLDLFPWIKEAYHWRDRLFRDHPGRITTDREISSTLYEFLETIVLYHGAEATANFFAAHADDCQVEAFCKKIRNYKQLPHVSQTLIHNYNSQPDPLALIAHNCSLEDVMSHLPNYFFRQGTVGNGVYENIDYEPCSAPLRGNLKAKNLRSKLLEGGDPIFCRFLTPIVKKLSTADFIVKYDLPRDQYEVTRKKAPNRD